jgi:hypothetical protein
MLIMPIGKTTVTIDDETAARLRNAAFKIQAREHRKVTMNEVILRLLLSADKPRESRSVDIGTAASIGAAVAVSDPNSGR